MNVDDFIPYQLRAVVFTPAVQRFQIAHVAGELLRQLPQFTGDPMILPIPADAPPEVPRIVLTEDRGGAQFQVAASRSDLYLNRQSGSHLDIADFFENAPEALEVLLAAVGTRPGRLAATGTFYYRCDDPPTTLATHFCKSELVDANGPLSDLRSFELHAKGRLEQLLEAVPVNSWIRCKTGTVSEAGTSFEAIVLERDINTLSEEAEARTFDVDGLRNFMREAGSQLMPGIEEFFPR